jgi:uncharacterized RDD family membrane protein YckC
MEEKYPLLTTRLQSSLIDGVLNIALMYIISMFMDKFPDTPESIRMFLFIAVWVLYEPVATSLGCTLGNYIMGIRVRQMIDPSKRIDFFQALFRYPIKLLLGAISFLTISSNPKRRAIHDFMSGSVMIEL